MFCTQCGNTIEQHARFCSRCGLELTRVQLVKQARKRDWAMHVNILGWLLVGFAVLTGIGAMTVIIVGQFVGNMPNWRSDFPFPMAQATVSLFVIIGLVLTAIAAGLACAGIGLLMYKHWGRVIALVVSALLVLHFPVGTAIGIYAFWVLCSQEGREHFQARSTRLAEQN